MSNEDKKAEKMVERSARVTDGHYELGMLWKVQNAQLPNNREVALKRFQYLKTRLKKRQRFEREVPS